MCFLPSFSFAQSLIGYQQKGRASYYASKFHGRKTASGERYSNQGMTAAHPKLPFNTMVKLTNPANGNSCIVRINDRGPFCRGRMIDVSKIAAEELGIIRAGAAMVNMEVIGFDGIVLEQSHPEQDWLFAEENRKIEEAQKKREQELIAEAKHKQQEAEEAQKAAAEAARLASADNFKPNRSYTIAGAEKTPKGFGIKVGSYTELEHAKNAAKGLIASKVEDVYISVIPSKGAKIYQVLAGSFTKKKVAKNFCAIVEKAGYEGYIKRHLN
ncbi:MAG: septal ring lytic transglycosylase RlpA family protein [Bacteroidota bacterium]